MVMWLWLALLNGFIFSISLCCDLGMVNTALVKTGIEKGFKPAFLLGLGSCFGDLAYLGLALLGVTVIFEIPAIRWILWIVGTIMLTWLTYQMLRKSFSSNPINLDSQVNGGARKEFLWGIGLAISSPTSILWFAAVGGPIIASLQIKEREVLFIFVFGFFIAGVVWSLFIAYMSSLTKKWNNTGFVRIITLISSVLFLVLAVKVFIDGFNSLIMSR